MLKQSKLMTLGILFSMSASMTILSPAKAAELSTYGIYPNQLKVGQAAVIGLEIEDCEVAPTNFTAEITNGSNSVTLTQASANFKVTISNSILKASWTYTGKNGKGVKAGEIYADIAVSGGCSGNVFEPMDAYGFVQNSKGTNIHGYIRRVEVNPNIDGFQVDWSKALGATSYEVEFSEFGTDVWVEAGTTTQTSMLISSEEFNLEYGKRYIAEVRPKYGQTAGEWSNTQSSRGYISKGHAWTSFVGDINRSEVNKFVSASDIQFNLELQNCQNTNGLLDPSYIVNEMWSGTMDGGIGSSEYGFNNYGSAELFTNYNFDVQGDTVNISWRLNDNLLVDTFKWGAYFLSNQGCPAENWTAYDYPFSEYSQFSIVENGKSSPQISGIDIVNKPSPTSLEFSWTAPTNSSDGPFTYSLYDTRLSDDESQWKLLKETTKRTMVIKNLAPKTWLPLLMRVTNSAGSDDYWLDAETLGLYTKTNSTMSLASLANQLKYSKTTQKTLKISASKLFASPNVCTVSKQKIKFSKKIGVCEVRITGKRSGQTFTKNVSIWTQK